MNQEFWKTKLLARIHDPGGRAIALFGDSARREDGAVQDLRTEIFGSSNVDESIEKAVKRGDCWAAGADRIQWPGQHSFECNVRWTQQPELIHPLCHDVYSLKTLRNVDVDEIKRRSLEHFRQLIHQDNGEINYRNTCLAYWRFGPALFEDENNDRLGALWQHLPADSRVPDHSIWDHLDLTAAFAGAFVGDKQNGPALLVVSIGPVQSFISNSRSTSDLWAASHLMSSLCWEALKTVCLDLGPDSVIFPRLRGIPIADLWLERECLLNESLFENAIWKNSRSQETNPLFRASLPNRFVAVVPYSESERIASKIEQRLQNWIQEIGEKTLSLLLERASLSVNSDTYAHRQIKSQLRGFPEVAWSVVPFSLIETGDKPKQTHLNTDRLQQAMAPFFGSNGGECGFLISDAWRVLRKPINSDNDCRIFEPNPGVLYPAIYDLAERALAATKNTRYFTQLKQIGWRCSVTGESEWLTVDKSQLENSYRQQDDTLWARVSRNDPSLVKEGEHLGALAAIKRVWPKLFANQITDDGTEVQRFVVSTHTMAIARQLKHWLRSSNEISEDDKRFLKKYSRVALPLGLVSGNYGERTELAKHVPAAVEQVLENNKLDEIKRLEQILFPANESNLQIEGYYSLLMMDGDKMGKILSGEDGRCAIRYKDSFHSFIRDKLEETAENNEDLRSYSDAKRAISPARHIAISAALNDFSLHVVPEIVEINHLGRVIYAGGDDVLAMLPVADLLSAMLQLRFAYSGMRNELFDNGNVKIDSDRGFVKSPEHGLMRMMGKNATASCGAIVAHHRAPLAAVIRELRLAENRAKNDGKRDAYSIVVVKRSGGALFFTDKWSRSFELLKRVTDYFSKAEVSRRAVYGIQSWVKNFPVDAGEEMLRTLFFDQLNAHRANSSRSEIDMLSKDLSQLACQFRQIDGLERFENFLLIAEFLARSVRNETVVSDNASNSI